MTHIPGIVGETIEITGYINAGTQGCVIVESTEHGDPIAVHLTSANARWLGVLIIAAADAADREAAAKCRQFAGMDVLRRAASLGEI